MTRYPAIVLALVWSCALAASVVLVPGRPLIGVIAIASSVPLMGLALILRPALLALAIAAALLAVGRAELPAGDPNMPMRAAALAGSTVALNGRVADDARSVGGGAEVLIEPAKVALGARPITEIGDLLIRLSCPDQLSLSDANIALGKLTQPHVTPSPWALPRPQSERRRWAGSRSPPRTWAVPPMSGRRSRSRPRRCSAGIPSSPGTSAFSSPSRARPRLSS